MKLLRKLITGVAVALAVLNLVFIVGVALFAMTLPPEMDTLALASDSSEPRSEATDIAEQEAD